MKPDPDQSLRDLRVELAALIDAIDRALQMVDPLEKSGEFYCIRADLRRLVISDPLEP